MLNIIIGNKAYSSWSLRGWLAVRQSGLAWRETVLPMFDDAWDTRRQQPDLAVSNGKVPTLWDGDMAVWESIAIIDWLDSRTGGTRFWPADPAAAALARSMAAEMHSGYVPLRVACCMNVRKIFPAQTPSAAVAENLARIESLWNQARTRFGGAGDFLFGEFGAADIMFAPVVSRITSYQLPVGAAAQDYVASVMAHPFMRDWIDDAGRESWVIDKYEQGPDYS